MKMSLTVCFVLLLQLASPANASRISLPSYESPERVELLIAEIAVDHIAANLGLLAAWRTRGDSMGVCRYIGAIKGQADIARMIAGEPRIGMLCLGVDHRAVDLNDFSDSLFDKCVRGAAITWPDLHQLRAKAATLKDFLQCAISRTEPGRDEHVGPLAGVAVLRRIQRLLTINLNYQADLWRDFSVPSCAHIGVVHGQGSVFSSQATLDRLGRDVSFPDPFRYKLDLVGPRARNRVAVCISSTTDAYAPYGDMRALGSLSQELRETLEHAQHDLNAIARLHGGN